MYDIVGKRRWYFLFSALITIPGLVFIVLGGLKPTVDFTGGTVWQVRFADRPSAGRGAGRARAARPPGGHRHGRSQTATCRSARTRSTCCRRRPRRPIPSVVPSASASAPRAAVGASAATATSTATARRRQRRASTHARAESCGKRVTGRPSRRARPFDTLRTALVARFGAAETASATTVGPAHRRRPDPQLGHPHHRRRALHPRLPVVPLRIPIRHGRHRGAPPRRDRGGGHLRDARLLLRARVRRPVRDGAAHDHRLQRPRHDRGLRPHPGEPHPPRRGAVRRHRQPLDPADPGPLDQHQPDGHRDAHRAAAARPGHRSGPSPWRSSSASSPGPTRRSSTPARSWWPGTSGTRAAGHARAPAGRSAR